MIWATSLHGLGLAGTEECPCHWAFFWATPSTIPQENQHLAFIVVVISLFFLFLWELGEGMQAFGLREMASGKRGCQFMVRHWACGLEGHPAIRTWILSQILKLPA